MNNESEEDRVIVGLDAVLYGESHHTPELGRTSCQKNQTRSGTSSISSYLHADLRYTSDQCQAGAARNLERRLSTEYRTVVIFLHKGWVMRWYV